jgi:hypothetical protein
VAVEVLYFFPPGRDIGERYVEKALPVIPDQLARVAVPLAGMLNRVLGRN